jgi:hypothetical protein
MAGIMHQASGTTGLIELLLENGERVMFCISARNASVLKGGLPACIHRWHNR